MADNTAESFYDPKGETAAAPARKKPGPKPKAAAAEQPKEAEAPKSGLAAAAQGVTESLSVDVTLAPGIAPEGETLDQSIERIGKLRQQNRKEWGEFSQKLALPKRKGYHRTGSMMLLAELTRHQRLAGRTESILGTENLLTRVVGSGRDSKALEAYAMELPQVFWKEEMDARHELAAARVEGIKKRPAMAQAGQAQASDAGKFYSPHDAKGLDPIHIRKRLIPLPGIQGSSGKREALFGDSALSHATPMESCAFGAYARS